MKSGSVSSKTAPTGYRSEVQPWQRQEARPQEGDWHGVGGRSLPGACPVGLMLFLEHSLPPPTLWTLSLECRGDLSGKISSARAGGMRTQQTGRGWGTTEPLTLWSPPPIPPLPGVIFDLPLSKTLRKALGKTRESSRVRTYFHDLRILANQP